MVVQIKAASTKRSGRERLQSINYFKFIVFFAATERKKAIIEKKNGDLGRPKDGDGDGAGGCGCGWGCGRGGCAGDGLEINTSGRGRGIFVYTWGKRLKRRLHFGFPSSFTKLRFYFGPSMNVVVSLFVRRRGKEEENGEKEEEKEDEERRKDKGEMASR